MPTTNGTFTLAGERAVPGTTIRAEQLNSPLEDVAAELNMTVRRDGTRPMMANLPMAGRRITDLGAGVNPSDAVTKAQLDAAADDVPAVRYEAQSLTEAQQDQARANILAQVELSVPTQAEVEAGIATDPRSWTAQRDRQGAIAAVALSSVRFDTAQSLTDPQKATAKNNLSLGPLASEGVGPQAESVWVAGASTNEGIISPAKLAAVINVKYQKFTLTESQTWTKPVGLPANTPVRVRVWGGGGAGGPGHVNAPGHYCGGGGGGGACVEWLCTYADLPSSIACVIGAGGVPSVSTTASSRRGGVTTFGSLVTAYGGEGGGASLTTNNGAGGGGGGMLSAGDGTSGGDVGGGDGGAISSATRTSAKCAEGGGGGGSAGSNTKGGSAALGGGGGGHGYTTVNSLPASDGGVSLWGGDGGAGAGGTYAATDGSIPAGGGGAGSGNSTYRLGGTGARGQIEIYIG